MFDLTTTNSMASLLTVIPLLLLFSLYASSMVGKTTQVLAIFTSLIPLAIITIIVNSYPLMNIFVLFYATLAVSLLIVGRGTFLMYKLTDKKFKSFTVKQVVRRTA